MEDWNALTLASAVGAAAFGALLRGAAIVLATLGLLLMLMGLGVLSSISEAAEGLVPPGEVTEEILLMPATQPNNIM
ncbi:MAG: hypothetical protein ACRDFA_03440 [bacterium]